MSTRYRYKTVPLMPERVIRLFVERMKYNSSFKDTIFYFFLYHLVFFMGVK